MVKLYKLNIALLLLIAPFIANAHNNCSGKKKAMAKGAMSKTTVATPEEYDYDITSLEFDIELTNTSSAVSGNVITHARTNIANFSIYAFELDNALTIDSVKIDGQLISSTNIATTGAVRKVTLTTPLAINTGFSAQVFYSGQTPKGNGQFFTGGLNVVKVGSGSHIMYSLSDPTFTDDWWPCKQALQDKIDSVSMWITVADTLTAASNGLLDKVTTLPGNKSRYEWKTNYPIEYYLIAAAVAPYTEYNYYMHFTDGTGDSMLVQNFVYDTSTFLTPTNKLLLDSTGLMIDHFSKLYSKYPFHKEKYGHCMTELGGGMEHQTMTFMSRPNLRTTLIAHELGHQWWGNNVTYGKWEDIWLSEGLATYTEQLYLEKYWGIAAAKATRTGVFNNVMALPNGSVWVNDTTNVSRIFDGRLTYYKGASATHMLRYIAPADSLFFAGLRAFQQQYQYSTAVTADFKTVMQQTYNIPLDSFFRQWIYGEGYPTYSVQWEQANNVVHIKMRQITSHNSVAFFNLPVQVKLTSLSGDTTVTLDMSDTAKHFILVWGKNMTDLIVDPDDHIINKTGPVLRDPAVLSVYNKEYPGLEIYPNPAADGWYVNGAAPGTAMKLHGINGQIIWQGVTDGSTYIPANNLPKGNYLLQLQTEGGRTSYHKLLK